MYIVAYPLLALVKIAHSLLFIYTIVVIAAVVMTWVNADPYNPIVRIIDQLTRPVFAKIRRYVKPFGQFDLAPLVLLLAILFVQEGILPVIARAASQML